MENLQKSLCMNFSTAITVLIILSLTIYPQPIQTNLQNDAPIFSNCWFYQTDESEIADVASDNESSFYVSFFSGKLISINSETIGKLWETFLAGNTASELLVDNENIYVTAKKTSEQEGGKAGDLILYSLNKLTGITRWQIELPQSDKAYIYDTDDSLVVILTNGSVYSLDKADGQLLWKTNLESNLSARPLKKTTEIILGMVNKQIIYLSLKDGKMLQKFEIDEQAAVLAEDTNENYLIVGDRKGAVWSLSKKKRKQGWKLRQGAEISNLLLTAQGLLISSFDNFIYLVSETSGKLIWKKRLPGRIAAEPQITDNNIIVSSIDESATFVLELNNGKLVNQIMLASGNFFTGESIRIDNLLIYATRRGIFSFSLSEGCRLQKNRL